MWNNLSWYYRHTTLVLDGFCCQSDGSWNFHGGELKTWLPCSIATGYNKDAFTHLYAFLPAGSWLLLSSLGQSPRARHWRKDATSNDRAHVSPCIEGRWKVCWSNRSAFAFVRQCLPCKDFAFLCLCCITVNPICLPLFFFATFPAIPYNYHDNDKISTQNSNLVQIIQPCWVSSTRCSVARETMLWHRLPRILTCTKKLWVSSWPIVTTLAIQNHSSRNDEEE